VYPGLIHTLARYIYLFIFFFNMRLYFDKGRLCAQIKATDQSVLLTNHFMAAVVESIATGFRFDFKLYLCMRPSATSA
jgi:hypothetical protein